MNRLLPGRLSNFGISVNDGVEVLLQTDVHHVIEDTIKTNTLVDVCTCDMGPPVSAKEKTEGQ